MHCSHRLRAWQREYPDVARQFHSFVVKLLATRLAAASEAIEALL
jgi:hypothetical protein